MKNPLILLFILSLSCSKNIMKEIKLDEKGKRINV